MRNWFKNLIHKGNIFVIRKELRKRNLVHRVLLDSKDDLYIVTIYVKSRTHNFAGDNVKDLMLDIDNFLIKL